MANDEESLRMMLLGFGVSELRELMSFVVGRNENGVEDLQRSALVLARSNSLPVKMKIRELHNGRTPSQPTIGPVRRERFLKEVAIPYYHISRPTNVPAFLTRPGPPPALAANTPRLSAPSSKHRDISFCKVYSRHPVTFKPTPLYQVLAVLLRPVITIPGKFSPCREVEYTFDLTPEQASAVANSRCAEGEFEMQIHLRCGLDARTGEQDDNFPFGFSAKINGIPCLLPEPVYMRYVGLIRPSQPIDITSSVNLDSLSTMTNQLTIDWALSDMKKYAVAVYLVKRIAPEQSMNKLESEGIGTKNTIVVNFEEEAGSSQAQDEAWEREKEAASGGLAADAAKEGEVIESEEELFDVDPFEASL